MPSLQRHGFVDIPKIRGLVVTALATMALTNIAIAQQASAVLPDAPVANDKNGCVQPVPVLAVSDINGRFKKVEAFLTHKIELKTVHKPYSGKGPRICGLTAGQKFDMFVQNGSEPLTFLTAGFNAAIAQASDDDSAFGQGAAGYGNGSGQLLQMMPPATSLERSSTRLSLEKTRDITVALPAVLLGDSVMRWCILLWLARIRVRRCSTIPSGLRLQHVLLCKTCIILEIVADSAPPQLELLRHSRQTWVRMYSGSSGRRSREP